MTSAASSHCRGREPASLREQDVDTAHPLIVMASVLGELIVLCKHFHATTFSAGTRLRPS